MPKGSSGFAATTSSAPRVAISPTTSVQPRTDRSGYTIHQQHKDGSQTVVTQRKLPTGTVQAVGFREKADHRLGTSTRLYSSGHNVVVGRDFQSRAFNGGPTHVTYKTGLHAAMLPSGRPVYRESFTVVRGFDGHQHRAIQKTVYVNYVYGRPVVLATPVVRVYEETLVYGRPLYYYRPSIYEPVFYRPFWGRLAAPIVVREECAVCPSRMVAFATPVTRYEDPVELLGDLQVASAFDEGAVRAEGGESTALVEMRKEMSELTRNVSDRASTDEGLRSQIGDPASLQKMQQTMNELTPVSVPEDVRQQIRAQVRLSIAQHQNQKPAIVSEIVSSGYAKIFLFQTSSPISVTDSGSGEECFLNPGDLLSIAKPPGGEGQAAQMKVVLSGNQSCQARQTVNVPVNDLQDMLNAFNERVEDNMKRVNACIASPNTCIRA
jgi:hypothetical protein